MASRGSGRIDQGASRSKQVRFSELVKASGKPETAVLWEKPKPGSPFMKAVRENRVLSVFQKPTGTHKDYGRLGYFPQPFTTYLVFPRKLSAPMDVGVVGINYGLLEQPRSKPTTGRTAKIKAEKPATPPKPRLKRFNVTILRTALMETTLSVTAADLTEAQKKAVLSVEARRFIPSRISSETKSITEAD